MNDESIPIRLLVKNETLIDYISSLYNLGKYYHSDVNDFDFLALDFCWFCVVIRFFHPHHNSYPRTLSQHSTTRLSIGQLMIYD